MALTITLSEPLTTVIEQRAKQMHVSPSQFAEKLIRIALLDGDFFTFANSDEDWQLLDLPNGVSESDKILLFGSSAIELGERFGDLEYIEYLLKNPPQDTMSFEEWVQVWPDIEAELKALDPVPLASGLF